MTNVETPTRVPGHGLLDGRTAVVTAAAGTGIGGATARRFLEEGARVLISDAHPRRLKEHEARLSREFGGAVASAVCDVIDESQVRACSTPPSGSTAGSAWSSTTRASAGPRRSST